MTSELLPGLPCPQLAPLRIYSPQNLTLSRANLSLHLYRHCTVWLYTRCHSGLLDRLVRCGDSCLFYDPYTVFSHSSSSGYEVCDGLSYTIRIIIGISICNPPSPLVGQSHPTDQPFSHHSSHLLHRHLEPDRLSQAPHRSGKPSLPPAGSPRTRRCEREPLRSQRCAAIRTTVIPGPDVRSLQSHHGRCSGAIMTVLSSPTYPTDIADAPCRSPSPRHPRTTRRRLRIPPFSPPKSESIAIRVTMRRF